MEYYSTLKKRKILSFKTTWIKLEDTMLSEIRQRQIVHDVTYMWTLKRELNKSTLLPWTFSSAEASSLYCESHLFFIVCTRSQPQGIYVFTDVYLDYSLPLFFFFVIHSFYFWHQNLIFPLEKSL